MRTWLRRLIAAKLALILCLSVVPVRAESPIQVVVDGRLLDFDVPPALTNGRVFVPLRKIFEVLGAGVDYDAATRTIEASRGNTRVRLTVGSTDARVDGRLVRLTDPPQVIGGRTLVPLRAVSELLGGQVDWDATSRTVTVISLPDATASPSGSGADEAKTAPTGSAAGGGTPGAGALLPEETPVRAGWYRLTGTVRNIRTGEPLTDVQVVARTDYGTSAAPSGAAAAPAAPAPGAPATAAPSGLSTGAPATATPPAAPAEAGAVAGPPPRALGAPASLDGGGGADPPVSPDPVLPVYEFKTETTRDGAFQLELPAGAAHRVSLTMACYAAQEFLVSETTRRYIGLEPSSPPFTTPLPASTFRVYGQVKDQNGRPVAGACAVASVPASTAYAINVPSGAVTHYLTDESGNYFVDWPAWQVIKVKATTANCDGPFFAPLGSQVSNF